MRYIFVINLLLLATITSYSQLFDDFDDGSFPEDPTWTGDVSDFKINEFGQLQLDAPEGGESTIFSPINLPEDTVSFAFKFNMDFNPSGSNLLRVYLALDGIDIETSSGYYLEVGETGSDDAIKLYRLVEGESVLLEIGQVGAVSTEPDVNMRIDVFPNGLWAILADYDGGNFLEEDIVFMEEELSVYGERYFGFGCKYTSSRTDLYFIDDVNVNIFQRDEVGPEVVEVNVVDSQSIEISFSEAVEETSVEILENFNILPSTIPVSVTIIDPTKVRINFSQTLPSDDSFTLEVSGVADLFGNVMPETQKFELNFARIPEKGDVIINEILFAPLGGDEEFVELRNLTDDFIDLSGVVLGNDTKPDGNIRAISEGIVMEPRGYIALTEEKQILETYYKTPSTANIIEMDIPDYNNDNGNVFVTNQFGQSLDSYDYDEDQHFELLALVKGVSLERKSPSLQTNDEDNWISASGQSNFATPGYENSANLSNINTEENLEFITKVFSPDGDNIDDEMLLGYNFDKGGYLATVEVRNVNGHLIKTILNNETLSTNGLIVWNGLDNDSKIANIGMYIIVGEAFHPDGDVLKIKKVCVLAGQID